QLFVLQIVQPGLAGLMDGSVSTLAPLFAAAVATQSTHDAFIVGLAASIGAGISMGFAEALSDDGTLTGRGHPWIRGIVCGLMTTLGGIGHTLPYLIPTLHAPPRSHRPHLAVPHPHLPRRHDNRRRRRHHRTRRDRLHPQPLHGHAVP